MVELYLEEMSARDIVDLKLVYESTKYLHNQLLKIRSILEKQYYPLKEDNKLQFRLGVLSKKNKVKFQQILADLSAINSELWKSAELTIDSTSMLFVDIHYNFNGKDVHTQLVGPNFSFTFLNFFADMVAKIKIDFYLYFTGSEFFPYAPETDLSIFCEAISTYLPVTSSFLSSIDEKDLNKHFESALPVVEKLNEEKVKRDKEKAEALENISNILNEDLVSFVREKAGVDYDEELIFEALKRSFE